LERADSIAIEQCLHWAEQGIRPGEALAALGVQWPRPITEWPLVQSVLVELWLDVMELPR